jgi:2-dehydropantoate 2-reductase
MHVAVLGAGGLGSLVGGHLARTGVDVTLIARPRHVEAIRRDGLRLTGVRGEHTVTENLTAVASPDEVEGHVDVLMLTVKGKDTDTALAQADGLRDQVGAVLSLQNSVSKAAELSAWIGADRVIGAATIEGATMTAPGEVLNSVTVPTTMYVGELDGRRSERVVALAEALDATGLGTRVADDIRQVEWEKLAQICVVSSWSVSTLAALPEAGVADGLSVRDGAAHFVQILKEVVAVYRSLGWEPQEFFAPLSRLRTLAEAEFDEGVEMLLDMARKLPPGARTSMHEDVLQGRRTEADAIILPFVERAEQAGVPAPTLVAAYRVVKTLDGLGAAPGG